MNPMLSAAMLMMALTTEFSYSPDGSMKKAVTSSGIADAVPESLEMQAAIATWGANSPGHNTLLKLIPRNVATKQEHEFLVYNSHGDTTHGTGMGLETGAPPSGDFSTARRTAWLQICHQAADVFFMAELQRMVSVNGTTDAVQIATNAALEREAYLTNKNMYLLDTSKSRAGDGASGRVFKGIFQQIREGTDGTVGSSDYGSHIVDMRGGDVTADNLRTKIAHILDYYGFPSVLLLPPNQRSILEGTLDGANRITMQGMESRIHKLGNQIAGLQSQGNVMWFATENVLGARHAKPRYSAPPATGYPATVPTVVPLAVAGGTSGNTSKWSATDAGNIYWVVTEVVNELEGAGTRAPAAPAFTAVAAGQEVRLTLTPGDANADRMRVYRGKENDTTPGGTSGAVTETWFIFEVAANGAVPVVTYDYNQSLPRTGYAVALDINSPVADAMFNPSGASLAANMKDAKEASMNYVGMRSPDTLSNVSMAQLGPGPMKLQLAPTAMYAPFGRPVLVRVARPIVRVPTRCFVFENVRDVTYL